VIVTGPGGETKVESSGCSITTVVGSPGLFGWRVQVKGTLTSLVHVTVVTPGPETKAGSLGCSTRIVVGSPGLSGCNVLVIGYLAFVNRVNVIYPGVSWITVVSPFGRVLVTGYPTLSVRSTVVYPGCSTMTVVKSPGLSGVKVRVRAAVNEGTIDVIVVSGVFTITVIIGEVPCGGTVYVVAGPSPNIVVVM
jgi:hypothetical protein